jgi:hypothetical protein
VSETSSTNLNGNWNYKSDSLSFEASVSSKRITIYILLQDDSKGLYWQGTFPEKAQEGDTITSQADTEALASSLYGSSDESKKFKFQDGKLSYEFSIMGTTTDVQLQKN